MRAKGRTGVICAESCAMASDQPNLIVRPGESSSDQEVVVVESSGKEAEYPRSQDFKSSRFH